MHTLEYTYGLGAFVKDSTTGNVGCVVEVCLDGAGVYYKVRFTDGDPTSVCDRVLFPEQLQDMPESWKVSS